MTVVTEKGLFPASRRNMGFLIPEMASLPISMQTDFQLLRTPVVLFYQICIAMIGDRRGLAANF